MIEPSCETSPGPLTPTKNETWTFKSANCSYRINENITLNTHIQSIDFPAAEPRPTEHTGQWTQIKMVAPTLSQGLGRNISSTTRFIATTLAYITQSEEDQPYHSEVTPECLAPEITACGLYWCGQVYTGAIVSDGSTRDFSPDAVSQVDRNLYANREVVFLQTDNGYCDDLTVPPSNGADFPDDARVFAVSPGASIQVSLVLNTLFNMTQKKGREQFPKFSDRDRGWYGLANAIFGDRDLPLTFSSIAASMTEHVRTSNLFELHGPRGWRYIARLLSM
ncbi:hypothetical protein SLS58_001497 [Diplodia intermedia]|uniref:Uncharacterized protein n=1 Tax=Diplodia intermedia TaxID=856260 RepID=A0ABR3U1B3_9PEZI